MNGFPTQQERDIAFESDVHRYARSLRAAVFTALTNGIDPDMVWDIVSLAFDDVASLDAYEDLAARGRLRVQELGIVPDSNVLTPPQQRAA